MDWTNADTVVSIWAIVVAFSFLLGYLVRGFKESDK